MLLHHSAKGIVRLLGDRVSAMADEPEEVAPGVDVG
jgi:hypothetical protein